MKIYKSLRHIKAALFEPSRPQRRAKGGPVFSPPENRSVAHPRAGLIESPRNERGTAKRRGYQFGGSPASYVPTMDLRNGPGAPPPPGLPPQQAGGGLGDIAAGLNLGNAIKKARSTYGGYDYGDPDLAAAAKAGVESGLSFDPSTGDVWKRGGAVRSRK